MYDRLFEVALVAGTGGDRRARRQPHPDHRRRVGRTQLPGRTDRIAQHRHGTRVYLGLQRGLAHVQISFDKAAGAKANSAGSRFRLRHPIISCFSEDYFGFFGDTILDARSL